MGLLIIGVLRGGTYILMVMGLGIVFGVMNIPNFAHGEFYMLGAYFGYFVFTILNLGPLLSIVFAAIATFIVGDILEVLLFRALRKGSEEGKWLMNTFSLTFGIGIVLQNGMRAMFGFRFKGVAEFWPGEVQLFTMEIPMEGEIKMKGESKELIKNEHIKQSYLGV